VHGFLLLSLLADAVFAGLLLVLCWRGPFPLSTQCVFAYLVTRLMVLLALVCRPCDAVDADAERPPPFAVSAALCGLACGGLACVVGRSLSLLSDSDSSGAVSLAWDCGVARMCVQIAQHCRAGKGPLVSMNGLSCAPAAPCPSVCSLSLLCFCAPWLCVTERNPCLNPSLCPSSAFAGFALHRGVAGEDWRVRVFVVCVTVCVADLAALWI
jgi:hypothetical protein